MTTTLKALRGKMPSMPKVKVKEVKQKTPRASLGDKFLSKLYKEPKTVTVRTWIVEPIESVVEEKEVKIGTQDIDLKSGRYNIDDQSYQNVKGKLFYNTEYGVANGTLKFGKQSTFDVDARIRKKMSARDNLHAIWSRWQLPLIVALVAIIASVIAFSVLGVVLAQLQQANLCLNDPNCMLLKIKTIQDKAKASAEAGGQ